MARGSGSLGVPGRVPRRPYGRYPGRDESVSLPVREATTVQPHSSSSETPDTPGWSGSTSCGTGGARPTSTPVSGPERQSTQLRTSDGTAVGTRHRPRNGTTRSKGGNTLPPTGLLRPCVNPDPGGTNQDRTKVPGPSTSHGRCYWSTPTGRTRTPFPGHSRPG